jgi:hypothetical protein
LLAGDQHPADRDRMAIQEVHMVSEHVTAGVRSRTPHPGRLAVAAVLSIVVANLVNALLALIGWSVFNVPDDFDQFQPAAYVILTVFGVIGASIAWAIIAAKSKNPVTLLYRLALIVVPVTLLADVALLVGGASPAGVIVLMIMHATVGVITYYALTRIAPAR